MFNFFLFSFHFKKLPFVLKIVKRILNLKASNFAYKWKELPDVTSFIVDI